MATSGIGSGGPSVFSVLRRISSAPAGPPSGPRCEMCAEPISEEHAHVVDLESRALLCTCRPCYLLFTDAEAHLRYRSVPDRYVAFRDVELGQGLWDELEIPIGLAFFFSNSRLGRTVALYPGPAGATESELPLGAWERVLAANPGIATLADDTEALLVRLPQGGGAAECHIVPITACYELAGRLRASWRGFDGGSEARKELDDFFARIRVLGQGARSA